MPNPNFPHQLAGNGMPAGLIRHVPSQAEREEVYKVQVMQVRTQAAGLATAMLANKGRTRETWDMWAEHIEHYIWQGVDHGDAAAPVLPGAPGS